MYLSQLLLILRAHKKLILITLLVTVLGTLSISLLLPKTYKATSSLLLNYKGNYPLPGLPMPGQLLPGFMATQIDIISSKNVALRVVDHLKLADSPAVIAQFNEVAEGKGTVRDWLAGSLLEKLEVIPSRESSVVDISFKDGDPQFVAAVANAFVDEYQKINIELKVDPMRRISTYFGEQSRLLRKNLEVAQNKLSKYQQDNGIVSVDNRFDAESNRLNEMGVLVMDVENARRAFEVASQRFLQSTIDGHAEQSDISVLDPAVPPIEPDGPRVLLNTLLSIFLGTLLGAGLAIVIEMLYRRVRSENDLREVLQIPVFGSIDWNAHKSPRSVLRSIFPRRLRLHHTWMR